MQPIHIALYEPEIPPNTGNVARLSAATGCPLHLIGKLGFRIDDASLKRAGLDYWHAVEMYRHDSLADFEASRTPPSRILCLSTRGKQPYTAVRYEPGDCLLFGPESRGLPDEVLERHAEHTLFIPMPAGKVRSLNLSTAVGVVVYEALRQRHGW